MNNLIIEKTMSTPYIHFNYDGRKLILEGESFPENAAKFYGPVMDWVREYLARIGEEETLVELEIIYFNSSTSKTFMTFFSLLDQAAKDGKNIVINWIVDEGNETAIECGEEFGEDLGFVKFNIILK